MTRVAVSAARRGGFSMVELLVAATLASTLLAASFGWLWTTAAAARGADAQAQGATAQAFAARMLRADLGTCVALCPPDLGVCGPTTLALLRREAGTGVETVVTIAWDPRRGVLWRNAAGSYLAEGVTSCAVRYFTPDGEEVVASDGTLGLEARRSVRRVRVEWTTVAGSAHVEGVVP
jgi:type II secretory pathway pseudopilin PulG